MKPSIRQGLRRLAIAVTVATGVPWIVCFSFIFAVKIGVAMHSIPPMPDFTFPESVPPLEKPFEEMTEKEQYARYVQVFKALSPGDAKRHSEWVHENARIKDAREEMLWVIPLTFLPPILLGALIYFGGLGIAWVIDGFRTHPE